MNKAKISNLIFLVIIGLLILPQTRKPIQIFLHKSIALITPVNVIDKKERVIINNYDWVLIKEDSSQYNLKQSQGNVVLINFWATWCAPCIAEMPSLQKLYDKYGDKVEFLFVTNDSIQKIEEFKKSKNYTFPIYRIISNYPEELITKSIPRTVIINKMREIVIDKSGAVNWYGDDILNEIEKLLKESI